MTEADNYFLMIWQEGGIISLFLFLYLSFVIIKQIARVYRHQDEPYLKAGCSAALSCYLCIMLWGITAVSFGLFPAGYYVWIFAGLSIAIGRMQKPETNPTTATRPEDSFLGKGQFSETSDGEIQDSHYKTLN